MNRICKAVLLTASVTALMLPTLGQEPPAGQQSQTVGDQVVQQVLEPLRTGMEAENIQLVLSVFDKSEMNSYSNLERQLQAFCQQFSEVNFRYRLLQAAAENNRGSAIAEMQMDALPYDATLVPVRRSVQARLQLKQDAKRWRIVGFTPADFFAVEYNPASAQPAR